MPISYREKRWKSLVIDNKQKNILFLIHTLGGGGAEKVLVDTVNKLDKQKFNITVMTVINTGINIKRLGADVQYKTIINPPKFLTSQSSSGSLSANSSLRVKVFGMIYKFIWSIMPASLIYRLFVREKYDVEVAFLEGISAKIIAKSTNPAAKKYCWIHVDFQNEHKSAGVFISPSAEKRCYDSFDKLVCVSEATKRGFEATVGLQKKTMVLRNIVDVDDILVKSKAALNAEDKKLWLSPKDKIVFSSVGRLAYQKGYDRLLLAIRNLNRKYKDSFEVNIIGDGPERVKLERYINEHKLDNVRLIGFHENPYKFIARSDMFIISSRAEGFSTVMTEALALGVPVISTAVSGTEVLPKNMVVKNSTRSLEEALAKIIHNKAHMLSIKESTETARDMLFKNTETSLADLERILSC